MTERMTNQAIPTPGPADLRKFGIVFGAMIAAIFGLLLPWLFDRPLPAWPWTVLGVMGLAGLLIPRALAPIYQGWMRLALLLNRVTTPIILGVVFYGLITPIGLVMRLTGKDPMNRKLDADIESYRVESTATEKERLEKPY